MSRLSWFAVFGWAGLLAIAPAAHAQVRPYIGYVYPAGGQQGTTFQVRLGGQNVDDINQVLVSGKGVSAKVVERYRRMGPLDMTLLREQLGELRRAFPALAGGRAGTSARAPGSSAAPSAIADTPASKPASGAAAEAARMMARIEQYMAEYVPRPACASISGIAILEVTIARDAPPGQRDLTIVTARGGASNPLPFHVGQLPEVARKPMRVSQFQVLGKEELAMRNRPEEEVEVRITVPCTMNGQIASGEVNRYRFEARRGQRLVISATARQLVPYIADAVPGWFQPVMALHDAAGKEVAYSDDFRFRPDPLIFFDVPKDGEYVLSITDAIYRGREDFVYRVSIGETPFVTSIFPLGGRVGSPPPIQMKGWNLDGAQVIQPGTEAGPGIHTVAARTKGLFSNRLPFVLDTLPECLEQEPNNDPARAQKVTLPIIVNGRVDRPDDWDVFEFTARAGDTIVAEVMARRLDSPLDSLLKLTDADGNVLAFNDDSEDPEAGLNTHHADSYLMFKAPADGVYRVSLGDTARSGGEEYAYRLRLSEPRPDFALRAVPSSFNMRSRSAGTVTVHVIRKDGFAGPIKLGLKNPPPGFTAPPVALAGAQASTRLTVRTDLVETKRPVSLVVEGRATIGQQEVAREAVPAEDRMQAFLWRHLVPAQELRVFVYNPSYEPPAKRIRRTPAPPPVETKPADSKPAVAATGPAPKPTFTKQQVAGRLRQLKALFEDYLLTEEFYDRKVAECEAAR